MSNPFAASVPAGGIPNHTDLVLSAVFIPLFFLVGFGTHYRLFFRYNRRFIWSILCFGFCMARIVALGFRIGVSKHPQGKTLNILAQVFIAAGVVLLWIVNMQMSRRFFGQLHPQRSKPMKYFINAACIIVIPILIMVITTVIQSFLTTDPSILSKDRTVRLVASCINVVLAFIPLPVIALALLLRPTSMSSVKSKETEVEEADVKNETTHVELAPGEPKTGFGPSSVNNAQRLISAALIAVPSALLTFEAGIRAAQGFYTHRPGTAPPWYMSKATFWVCIFALELIAVTILGFAMLPKRFSNLRL